MGIIEPGEWILPWSICLYVLLDVLHQIVETFPCMIPCALVMHIAERPLNRVGTRTVRRQPEQHEAWMIGSPLLDGFGFMPTVVIRNHRDARNLSSRVRGIQQGEECSKQPSVFTRTEAIERLARGEMQRPRASVFLILPVLRYLGLPLRQLEQTLWRRDVNVGQVRNAPKRDLEWDVRVVVWPAFQRRWEEERRQL